MKIEASKATINNVIKEMGLSKRNAKPKETYRVDAEGDIRNAVTFAVLLSRLIQTTPPIHPGLLKNLDSTQLRFNAHETTPGYITDEFRASGLPAHEAEKRSRPYSVKMFTLQGADGYVDPLLFVMKAQEVTEGQIWKMQIAEFGPYRDSGHIWLIPSLHGENAVHLYLDQNAKLLKMFQEQQVDVLKYAASCSGIQQANDVGPVHALMHRYIYEQKYAGQNHQRTLDSLNRRLKEYEKKLRPVTVRRLNQLVKVIQPFLSNVFGESQSPPRI